MSSRVPKESIQKPSKLSGAPLNQKRFHCSQLRALARLLPCMLRPQRDSGTLDKKVTDVGKCLAGQLGRLLIDN